MTPILPLSRALVSCTVICCIFSFIPVIPRTNAPLLFFYLFASYLQFCSGLGWSTNQTLPGERLSSLPGGKGEERWNMALSAIVWGFLLDCFWYILAYHTKAWKQRHTLTNDNSRDNGRPRSQRRAPARSLATLTVVKVKLKLYVFAHLEQSDTQKQGVKKPKSCSCVSVRCSLKVAL